MTRRSNPPIIFDDEIDITADFQLEKITKNDLKNLDRYLKRQGLEEFEVPRLSITGGPDKPKLGAISIVRKKPGKEFVPPRQAFDGRPVVFRGRPKPPQPSSRDGILTAVVGDIHGMDYHEEAFEALLTWLKIAKPNEFIFNGDLFDFHQISRHKKRNPFMESVNEEVQFVGQLVSRILSNLTDECQVFMNLGNHDIRIEDLITDRVPELHGLCQVGSDQPVYSLKHLLQLDQLGIVLNEDPDHPEHWTHSQHVLTDDFVVRHGGAIGQGAGNSVRKQIDKIHASEINGHVHRLGTVFKTVPTVDRNGLTFSGTEGGCLCNRNPDYMKDPDWQLGWTCVTRFDDGLTSTELIPFDEKRGGVWRGKRFK